MDFDITKEERLYLQNMARRYGEYAELDVMKKRTALWFSHNRLDSERPVVVVENETFNEDFLPPLRCASSLGRFIERVLLEAIENFEQINDDKVIPPYFPVDPKIDMLPFGATIEKKYSEDSRGRKIGYANTHIIKNLKEDLPHLKPSIYSVDRDATLLLKEVVEECLGGILPVVIKNRSLNWHVMPTKHIIDLMGMEALMFAMFDHPEELHRLFDFIKEDILRYLRWQEEQGLLTLDNGNDYAGSGSYGFTDELPGRDFSGGEGVRTRDLWGNMNSQESVGISPDMFGEFIFPCYLELAREFGLLYYGCCEPVHDVWEEYLSKLPNLRKVSVSPWCDTRKMGELLKGGRTIYSRKPNPNYIGVGKELDEENFRTHIIDTLEAARGNTLEIVFRDIYTLEGNRKKPGRAVEIVRELIDSLW